MNSLPMHGAFVVLSLDPDATVGRNYDPTWPLRMRKTVQTKKYVAYVGKRILNNTYPFYFVYQRPQPNKDATLSEESSSESDEPEEKKNISESQDYLISPDPVEISPSCSEPFPWSNCAINGVHVAYAKCAHVKVWGAPQYAVEDPDLLDYIQQRCRTEREQWNHWRIEGTKGRELSPLFACLEFTDLEAEEEGIIRKLGLTERKVREAESLLPVVRVSFDLSLAQGQLNGIEDYYTELRTLR
ncbi:hypothetical protein BDP27DRAFT_1327461 [Rhodocollybia butyracea]|uniref:Uncharacterized protein n=1 Tax=Rhodocollybia butyracea TaxID=206335 RepID=A0A9P5U7W0_9AGAR|nr:hypothetical protein BDP27DRAFT_1327461 [Rhodocollybia butyracea]